MENWKLDVKRAKTKRRRRAPLEEGRDGLVENHFAFYSSAKRARW